MCEHCEGRGVQSRKDQVAIDQSALLALHVRAAPAAPPLFTSANTALPPFLLKHTTGSQARAGRGCLFLLFCQH